jgi:uncharacterized protein (UPF0248 family)
MELRDILNKHLWHLGTLDALTITVRHRGAPRDERRIVGSEVLTVGPKGVHLISHYEDEDAVFVPYHRFLKVEAPEGVVWSGL